MFQKNKKAFYICARIYARPNGQRRNGRVVECTGLENRRGSHLRGFESLFLRRRKTRNESCGFFVSRIREKLAFQRIRENKKTNRHQAVRVFLLNGPLLGSRAQRSEASNPAKSSLLNGLGNKKHPKRHQAFCLVFLLKGPFLGSPQVIPQFRIL